MISHEDTSLLAGHSVLILEDQVLIALDMEDMLLSLGAQACWLASDTDEAKRLLSQEQASLAVLDFNLGHENCEVIADQLIASGMPFLFFTGYGERAVIPARFRAVPMVSKPVSREVLAAQLRLALAQSGAPRPV